MKIVISEIFSQTPAEAEAEYRMNIQNNSLWDDKYDPIKRREADQRYMAVMMGSTNFPNTRNPEPIAKLDIEDQGQSASIFLPASSTLAHIVAESNRELHARQLMQKYFPR